MRLWTRSGTKILGLDFGRMYVLSAELSLSVLGVLKLQGQLFTWLGAEYSALGFPIVSHQISGM